jgi:hypothetical protein
MTGLYYGMKTGRASNKRSRIRPSLAAERMF